jgi:hypothetical protein
VARNVLLERPWQQTILEKSPGAVATGEEIPNWIRAVSMGQRSLSNELAFGGAEFVPRQIS